MHKQLNLVLVIGTKKYLTVYSLYGPIVDPFNQCSYIRW